MQKYCLVLFCSLNTESKWKWLMNVYRHYCSKSKKSEKVGMYRVSLKKGSLRDWYAQFASEFFIPRLKTVYMKNGSYRLIPFLFSLVNCICTSDCWTLAFDVISFLAMHLHTSYLSFFYTGKNFGQKSLHRRTANGFLYFLIHPPQRQQLYINPDQSSTIQHIHWNPDQHVSSYIHHIQVLCCFVATAW